MDPLLILLVGMAVVVGSILWLRVHAFLALLAGAFLVALITPNASLEEYALSKGASATEAAKFAAQSPGARLAAEFGDTCAEVGIIIAMAAIIGRCLLESGAADRIVRSTLKTVGESRAPIAFVVSGFVLAVPVFFDTVFFLLIPLGKALGLRKPKEYGLYIMSIIAGGTMAHSLVPPTPGPLFVASRLGVDLIHMIVGGTIVGLLSASVGYAYARWLNARWPVPLRDSDDAGLKELAEQTARATTALPSIWLSLIPILLPLFLLTAASATPFLLASSPEAFSESSPRLARILTVVGDKNIALTVAAVIALGILISRKQQDGQAVRTGIQSALASGGIIILITAAGGAFGGALQHTGIADRIQAVAGDIAVLPLAFFITALVRTAQGSATVAMITAVGLVEGLAAPGQLGFHPLYLALAIGCGSKPFPWMNDSGFWVIGKMSGMTEKETLRCFSVMVSAMGLAGLILVMMLARLFPLI